ncbi:NADPH-dependent 7-cyano-7-deazaguanine reductase [Colwellia sp. MT41]|uniref:NADPH-dependent 7-cyano-7-deazaguanine reductase n=1 Tax=Colwellia marinimaniae TaxID=1513592 RepID=A0ABQ0MUL8_9GAMM|nr:MULTISPECIES: NADPH-dependent 7-cyano-7-deazaguanine reductase QueF [Colwellia]ALO35368.1 NADPH-dependent 7-cyano-7-deazaguanine reductase [Colwellia sp. MT41]GAW96051.1 NADPH-dependent 7-cyano-7-deazaguanine reductase [Colwellia marinimaniae]
MANYQNATELSKLTLGKSTEYCSEYTAELLQGVPRSLNRDDLALDPNNLPFIGEDVWYGYELSWLNEKGKPVVAVAEFRFACTSDNIVESKSFKLYLNSFNQTRFASIKDVEQILIKDLSNIAGSPAKVRLFAVDHCPALAIAKKPDNCICIDGADISIDNYQYDAQLLAQAQKKDKSAKVEEHLVSHLLKSNCLITNQPDWASIYIHYRGKAIDHATLLKYLISFRQHNEFHEQCIERIYCDLQKFCQLDELTVFARYTRRGGLDINPFRSSHTEQAPFARTLRQ